LLDGSREFEAGIHSVVWDGRDDNGNQMSSGIYFYRMATRDFTETRRMVLVK
jgi:flagellar hook assembly protein FlgD